MSEKNQVERYGFQVWKEDVDGVGEIIHDGFAQARGFDRAVQMVRNTLRKNHLDFESLGWTVWLEKDNRIYQEFKGNELVEEGTV
ncbi:hypothetical protein [Paludifilum halophilum]|uniref:Uncharacterized protein n=1 Tax=Paludifilum halophilum TaxID=1642702 RepID=A0A235B178_9BACL|nr:hypothetical protein [Paludifilum halophilum]OYD06058.1 hypothetical protein CHM34_18330 [Paludifilum halophilum]